MSKSRAWLCWGAMRYNGSVYLSYGQERLRPFAWLSRSYH